MGQLARRCMPSFPKGGFPRTFRQHLIMLPSYNPKASMPLAKIWEDKARSAFFLKVVPYELV
jgi:hypothetical protein